MNIKNYTSNVDVERTIARIESKLMAVGASGIWKTFNQNREVDSLIFTITLPGTKPCSIRVPANIEACFEAMWREYTLKTKRIPPEAKQRIREQASRTAWKLMQDWVDVQISLIVMRQADFREVFLAYIWDGKETFFTKLKGDGFKALPESTGRGQ